MESRLFVGHGLDEHHTFLVVCEEREEGEEGSFGYIGPMIRESRENPLLQFPVIEHLFTVEEMPVKP